MQSDMHYYGTYALARIAGFSPQKAEIIAYSAQFVDDSTKSNSDVHQDGGMLYGIATAHHNLDTVHNAKFDLAEQRRVWIPFHFIPGAQGDTTSQQLICRKNSKVVNEMFDTHIMHAADCAYGYHLIGIACHVYADTFSHYGFSGISSRENEIEQDSLLLNVTNAEMKATLMSGFGLFFSKYAPSFMTKNWRRFVLDNAEQAVGYLGHGGVGTFPDRPYLKWQFRYQASQLLSSRNNPETFLEGCEHLYKKLLAFGHSLPTSDDFIPEVNFQNISHIIKDILDTEAAHNERIALWKSAILSNQLFTSASNESDFLNYDFRRWENDKNITFTQLSKSCEGTKLDVYKFHQAAAHHRYYVLKDLLPSYGLAVY